MSTLSFMVEAGAKSCIILGVLDLLMRCAGMDVLEV